MKTPCLTIIIQLVEITRDRTNEDQLNDTGSHFSSASVAKVNNYGMRETQLAASGGAWSRLYAHLREGYDGQEQGCGGIEYR